MRSTTTGAELGAAAAGRSLLLAGIGIAVLLGSVLYAPWAENGPIVCPFRWFTGLPCPGCGLTRSFCAVAHGQWRHALAAHLLGPLLFGMLVLAVPLLLSRGLWRRTLPAPAKLLFGRGTWYAIGAAFILYHFARLMGLAWSGGLWSGVRASAAADLLRWVWR